METVFYVSLATFSLNLQSLTKSHKPLLFFDCGEKLFGFLAKTFQRGGQNFSCSVSTETLEENKTMKKKLFFDSFLEFDNKRFRCLAVLFGRICQKWIVNVQRKFRKWTFFNLKVPTSIVGLWTKNVRTFCRNILPVHQDSFLRIKPFLSRKTEFLQKSEEVCFSDFRQNYIGFMGTRKAEKLSKKDCTCPFDFSEQFFSEKEQ